MMEVSQPSTQHGTTNLHVLRALQQTCFVNTISRTELVHICVFRTTQLSTEYKSAALCPLCAWKVPGSNLILKNSYPNFLMVFLSPSRQKGTAVLQTMTTSQLIH
jgi:hypothetical protein